MNANFDPTELPEALLTAPPRDFESLRDLHTRSCSRFRGTLGWLVLSVGVMPPVLIGAILHVRVERVGWDTAYEGFGWLLTGHSIILVCWLIPTWRWVRYNTAQLRRLLERGVACPTQVKSLNRHQAYGVVSFSFTDPTTARRLETATLQAWSFELEVPRVTSLVLVDPDDPSVVALITPGLIYGTYGAFMPDRRKVVVGA